MWEREKFKMWNTLCKIPTTADYGRVTLNNIICWTRHKTMVVCLNITWNNNNNEKKKTERKQGSVLNENGNSIAANIAMDK